MENNHKRGSATVAFLLGTMAGGITALLFAPKTGAQMRHGLKRGAHDLREKGGLLVHDVEEKAETVTGAMKGAVSEARNTYRDELDKRRVASGAETKHYAEAETVGNKA
jgi:gas vesicle protein